MHISYLQGSFYNNPQGTNILCIISPFTYYNSCKTIDNYIMRFSKPFQNNIFCSSFCLTIFHHHIFKHNFGFMHCINAFILQSNSSITPDSFSIYVLEQCIHSPKQLQYDNSNLYLHYWKSICTVFTIQLTMPTLCHIWILFYLHCFDALSFHHIMKNLNSIPAIMS